MGRTEQKQATGEAIALRVARRNAENWRRLYEAERAAKDAALAEVVRLQAEIDKLRKG